MRPPDLCVCNKPCERNRVFAKAGQSEHEYYLSTFVKIRNRRDVGRIAREHRLLVDGGRELTVEAARGLHHRARIEQRIHVQLCLCGSRHWKHTPSPTHRAHLLSRLNKQHNTRCTDLLLFGGGSLCQTVHV